MQRKPVDVRALAAVITSDDLALTAGGMPSPRSSTSGTQPRVDTTNTGSNSNGGNSYSTTPTEMYRPGEGRNQNPWKTWEGQYTHYKDGTTRYDGPNGTWQTR